MRQWVGVTVKLSLFCTACCLLGVLSWQRQSFSMSLAGSEILSGANGSHARTIDNAQGVSALATVCGLVLCARLYRSDQCELRRANHARRPRHVCRRFRICSWHVLLGLFHFRGSKQLDLGKSRRENMDCPDHDHLGNTGGPHSCGYRPDKLCYSALLAGRRGGWILSWCYPLLHLLVSEPPSRPHRFRLSGRSAG